MGNKFRSWLRQNGQQPRHLSQQVKQREFAQHLVTVVIMWLRRSEQIGHVGPSGCGTAVAAALAAAAADTAFACTCA